MRFRVQVPKRYPGVHFRSSMSLDDRSQKYAEDGEIVTGRLSPNGQWLQADGHGLYLPMRVGELRILEPVGTTPPGEPAGGAAGPRTPPPALPSGLERQFVVRVPRNYPGIQFRSSKDLNDRHELSAARDERVCGHVEDDGTWLRVHRAGKVLFLPISLGGTSVLVPAVVDERDGVSKKSPQAPHQQDHDAAPPSSPGSFVGCNWCNRLAVDAEVVREKD